MSFTGGESAGRAAAIRFPREFGGYRLLGRLGSGGMGTVYEAEQLETGRRVAVKVLQQQLDSPEMRHRFLREGRLAASVTHPNTVYVFGSEEVGGAAVITMEIAPGGTLQDELDRRGRLPVRAAVDAILDVVAGLEATYAAGVLHRDVKPSNCFVGQDGSVKVGDFGLSVSTLADDTYATATGVVMGTPAYAPPEQLRGDEVDLQADIYAVGATLFALLTGRPPFEGKNAVQVVASVISQEPPLLTSLRPDAPPALEGVLARCLAKEPAARYADYMSLRNALLPFSSRELEPASMAVRAPAAWIDFLVGFLPPYVAFMLVVGAEDLLIRPVVERSLYSARYYLTLLGIGVLYFALAEGLWGAGIGKRLRGLRVVRRNGRRPGMARALVRILVPLACVEGVRVPLMMRILPVGEWTSTETAIFVLAAVLCGWIPVLLAWRVRGETGFATPWDRASGTRVVVAPKGTLRPAVSVPERQARGDEHARHVGPYCAADVIVPGEWLAAADPVLRRGVWLLRRSSEPSLARRAVTRPGRMRWLQHVHLGGDTWDAFEAPPGVPFASLVVTGTRVPWGTLRHWLHDLASELWEAANDRTLPSHLTLQHVWITAAGRAMVLDRPWPNAGGPRTDFPVHDVAGQQRFLHAVASFVEPTNLPLHARAVLQNLERSRFEKLSFLAGTLRGLLEKPADVGRGVRAGSLLVVPLYVWVAVFVGYYHDKQLGDPLVAVVTVSVLVALGVALAQLLAIPFRTMAGHLIFRLAVVDASGEPASRRRLLLRWVIAWLPLILPAAILGAIRQPAGVTSLAFAVVLVLWMGAVAHAVAYPHRGLHDRLAGTWVVRR